MIQGLRNIFCHSIIMVKTVWYATLDFVCYGIERKMGVILRCELAAHKKQMLKLPHVILFKILWAMFLPDIWIGLQLGKLSPK